ncbi:MAG: hypothetical protein AAFR58_07890 [Cyanobacteria bacterium J06627_28]
MEEKDEGGTMKDELNLDQKLGIWQVWMARWQNWLTKLAKCRLADGLAE